MDELQNDNLYFYSIGNINWEIGAWRQLIKIAPVLEICRRYNVKKMVDFGSGAGDVKRFLFQNNSAPQYFLAIDKNKEGQADIITDVCNEIDVLENGSIDFVCCLDLIQNIAESKRILLYNEINRVLQPNGIVYLFFRNAKIEADSNNRSHHVSGEYIENILDFFKEYSKISCWGVNSIQNREDITGFFPYEFSRIFYSLDDLDFSKFIGIILQKNGN